MRVQPCQTFAPRPVRKSCRPLSYGLRFDRRGKPTRRHSEMMAQFTAEALADMLEASNMVLMMKPPAEPVDVRTDRDRHLT